MRLDKLVLHGFKSFAEKTSFDFAKNFTAVVGPNGSGKSNIADAIRWVTGEQSLKLLRGKQSQDLIFSGSEQLAKLGMAQVELHLDNRDHMFPLEYEEITLSRKLFRNGESEYRINNAQVRLQDMAMMLAQARFGQKSYAVIGQGMITHFLTSTPQERKDFFDEATGVKEFQMKRDQAINKLIRTEEHLVQSEALMTEIEPHLRSLTRLVKRLERREKIEQELREVHLAYYGSTWNELQTDRDRLRTQYSALEKNIHEIQQHIDAQQAESDKMAGGASRGERYQHLQNDFNQLLEQKSRLMQEQAVLKGKLEVEHEKQGELSLIWLTRKEDELKRDAQQYESEAHLLHEQVQREEQELKRRMVALEALAAEFRDEEYSILKLREQIENESHALSVPEIQDRLKILFDEQEAFLRELLQTKSLDQFKVVQTSAKKITERLADLLDTLDSTDRGTLEALRVELKRKEQMLERLVRERDQAQHDANELRVSMESAKAKNSMLHVQLERVQDQLSTVQSDIDEAQQSKQHASKQAQAEEYARQLLGYEERMAKLQTQLDAARAHIDLFNQEEEEKKTQLLAIQNELRALSRKLSGAQQEMSSIEINLARIETRQEDVRAEIEREVAIDFHAQIFRYENGDIVDHLQAEQKISNLKKQLEAIGSVDEQTVKEYEETKTRFEFLETQTGDLNKAIQSLEQIIDELDKTIHTQFQANFKRINDGFQKYFKVLFGGGSAKLALMTDLDEPTPPPTDGVPDTATAVVASEQGSEELAAPLERELLGKKKKKQRIVSGIEILATPPGKKITHITALSGGEKSLVSIALLCAIIANNPSPFVVLDEVEAALDEENSEKLAAILKQLAQHTQIIVITHNRVTMRAADILYGVTIGKDGKSHILSVELEEAEELVQE